MTARDDDILRLKAHIVGQERQRQFSKFSAKAHLPH